MNTSKIYTACEPVENSFEQFLFTCSGCEQQLETKEKVVWNRKLCSMCKDIIDEKCKNPIKQEIKNPPESIFQEAERIISNDRRKEYGDATESFNKIAMVWSALKGVQFSSREVGLMMIAFKVIREWNKHKRDNLVDVAGYAGLVEMICEDSGVVINNKIYTKNELYVSWINAKTEEEIFSWIKSHSDYELDYVTTEDHNRGRIITHSRRTKCKICLPKYNYTETEGHEINCVCPLCSTKRSDTNFTNPLKEQVKDTF